MTSIENMFYEVFRIKGEQHRDTGYQPRSHSRLHAQTNMKRRSSSTRLSGVTVPEGLPEDDCDTPKQMKRSNTSVVPVSGTVPTNSPSIDKIVVVKPEVAVASPVKCEKLAGKLVGYHSSAAVSTPALSSVLLSQINVCYETSMLDLASDQSLTHSAR